MKILTRPLLLVSLLAASLAGCATTQLQTPSGFAAHDSGEGYDLRVSDGEGVVLAVRTEKNRPQGDLKYWTSALDSQLRKSGYEARDAKDVKSADGHAGKQVRYVLHAEGRDLVFWLSVFVTGRHVVIVEAGGDGAFFAPKAELVSGAIATLEVG